MPRFASYWLRLCIPWNGQIVARQVARAVAEKRIRAICVVTTLAIARYVTQWNVSCNLYHHNVAKTLRRNISQCNSALRQLHGMLPDNEIMMEMSGISFWFRRLFLVYLGSFCLNLRCLQRIFKNKPHQRLRRTSEARLKKGKIEQQNAIPNDERGDLRLAWETFWRLSKLSLHVITYISVHKWALITQSLQTS